MKSGSHTETQGKQEALTAARKEVHAATTAAAVSAAPAEEHCRGVLGGG